MKTQLSKTENNFKILKPLKIMKNTIVSLATSFALFVLSFTAVYAQAVLPSGSWGITPNVVTPNINNPVGTYYNVACNTMPDLYFTNFRVDEVIPGAYEGTGIYQRRTYTVIFVATVINGGGVQSEKCKILAEGSQYNANLFLYGNCIKIDPLRPNVTVTFSGEMYVTVPASDNSANIRLTVDSPCSEEFVPGYGKVKECNESNNKSSVITVNLF